MLENNKSIKVKFGIFLSLLQLLSVLFCACAEKGRKEDTERGPELYGFSSAAPADGGIYRISGENGAHIVFTDFKSGKNLPLCTKKNCTHEAWTDATPEEERCDAYWEDDPFSIFSTDEGLFVFSGKNFLEMSLSFCRKDGSLHRKLAENVDVLGGVLTDGSVLYFVKRMPVFDKSIGDENGEDPLVFPTKISIQRIRVDSGEAEDITEPATLFSPSIRIIGIVNSRLYYMYSGSKTPISPLNVDSGKEIPIHGFYTDLKSKKTEQCFEDLWKENQAYTGQAHLLGDQLYMAVFDPQTYTENTGENSKYFPSFYNGKILKIRLGDEKTEATVAKTVEKFLYSTLPNSIFSDKYAFLRSEGKEEIRVVDLETGDSCSLSEEYYEHYLPLYVMGDWLLVSVPWPDSIPLNEGFSGDVRINAAVKMQEYLHENDKRNLDDRLIYLP